SRDGEPTTEGETDMPLVDRFVDNEFTRQVGRTGAVVNLGGEYSMPTPDWVRMRQPYLDSRGRACVSITDLDYRQGHRTRGFTRNDSHGGEKKPLRRAYTIFELMARGYPTPLLANAATLRKE